MAQPAHEPAENDGGPARPVSESGENGSFGNPSSGSTRWVIVVTLAVITLVLDQLTKSWALGGLSDFAPRPVVWTLQFKLAFNTGMAFAKGSGSGPIIGVVALAIAVAMVLFARQTTSRIQLFAIGMIIGGAGGNVLDRLLRVGEFGSPDGGGFMSGAVVDFIDLQWWPVFNIADAAVVGGGILLALSMFFMDDERDPEPSTARPATNEPLAYEPVADEPVVSESGPEDTTIEAATPAPSTADAAIFDDPAVSDDASD